MCIRDRPKALEKERQQFQFERRTAFRAQRFGQGYDLVVTKVERTDVVRRHAHHHPQVRSNGDTCYNLIAHNDMQLRDRSFRAAAWFDSTCRVISDWSCPGTSIRNRRRPYADLR